MKPRIVAVSVTDEMLSVADGLLRTIEHYDRSTAIHQEAVGAMSDRLAREMGLDGDHAAFVGLVGRLHDMGKIAISRDILTKKARLEPHEWEEVRMHPVHGFQILSDLGSLRAIAHLARAHHERMDGDGYPDRLFGHEIPLESRIVAVTDAFDAMTSGRPYQRTRTPEEALDELVRCSGSQFDADVVQAFVTMLGIEERRRLSRFSA